MTKFDIFFQSPPSEKNGSNSLFWIFLKIKLILDFQKSKPSFKFEGNPSRNGGSIQATWQNLTFFAKSPSQKNGSPFWNFLKIELIKDFHKCKPSMKFECNPSINEGCIQATWQNLTFFTKSPFWKKVPLLDFPENRTHPSFYKSKPSFKFEGNQSRNEVSIQAKR